MDFKDTIEATGSTIKHSELGRLTPFIRAWNDMEWNQVGQSTGQDAAVNERDFRTINLFADLGQRDAAGQQAAILREFGISLYRRFADDRTKRRWELKLTLPDSAQVDDVQAKLKNPGFVTYRQMMESCKSLMDRYVCLNLTNALLVNGVKRSDAFNVNLRQWGSTLEYANIRKMHSLKPFVTAYGPRDVAECPGKALAEKLVYQMGHISESSLAAAFGRLILEVFMRCRAED
jgi:hypothetical protein